MKYVAEMGSGLIIFIKIGSANQKLMGDTHRQTAWCSHKPTFIFQNKVSRIKGLTLRGK
jgi:hypothetical protein